MLFEGGFDKQAISNHILPSSRCFFLSIPKCLKRNNNDTKKMAMIYNKQKPVRHTHEGVNIASLKLTGRDNGYYYCACTSYHKSHPLSLPPAHTTPSAAPTKKTCGNPSYLSNLTWGSVRNHGFHSPPSGILVHTSTRLRDTNKQIKQNIQCCFSPLSIFAF